MNVIKLPSIESKKISNTLYEAINKRYSCRNFESKSLTLDQISYLLWSGQGEIGQGLKVRKTAPSAGATYPLELFLVVGKNSLDDMPCGVYHYIQKSHSLKLLIKEDVSLRLVSACLGQSFVIDACVNIVIATKYERTTSKYQERGPRYVHMEAGSVTQNIHLVSAALGLGTVIIGAFDDLEVKNVLNLSEFEPLALMPVGYPKYKEKI